MNIEIKEETTFIATSRVERCAILELPGGIKVESGVLMDILYSLEGMHYDDDRWLDIEDEALCQFLIQHKVMHKSSRGNVWAGENREAFHQKVYEASEKGYRKRIPDVLYVKTNDGYPNYKETESATVRVAKDGDGVLYAQRENPICPLDVHDDPALTSLLAHCAAYGVEVRYDPETRTHTLTYI